MRFGNKARVLIVVKTYPYPAHKNEELVCVAGITDLGEWVRLYPQWVEIVLEPAGQGSDNRKESRRPTLETLSKQGEPLSAAHNWRDRKEVIDRVVVTTPRQLSAQCDGDGTSLGIVRPTRVHDIEIQETDPEWSTEQLGFINQVSLVDRKEQPLRKLPFEFRYVFECDDDTDTEPGPHRALITDWELGTLYLKEERRLGDRAQAAQSVKDKYLNDLCGRKKAPLFFMSTSGTRSPWSVLGVFHPERDSQMSLLD